jgi:predicted nuclease of predicted toxin-antitoxin system
MKDEKYFDDIENKSENEIDPRLRFDAFMAGVKDGGLRSVSSINLLVCYIVANINGKVTADNIIRTIDEGMLANHFEIADAISKLKSSGIIIESEDGTLSLIDDGLSSIELIEKDLPLTVRERSINICQKIIAREKYERENKAEIIKTDKGYNVNLHISDKDTDFMNLTLYTASEEQAELIKEKFVTNPIKVYETLIESIFNE